MKQTVSLAPFVSPFAGHVEMSKFRKFLPPFLLLSPSIVLLLTFVHIPAIHTIYLSFFSTPKGRRPSKFKGLENYQDMIADPVFWKVLGNNLIYAITTIPASIIIALIMAQLVNSALPGRPFLRFSFFLPVVLPLIAVGNIWLFFYLPGFGLIDQIGSLFGLPNTNILGSSETVLWGIVGVSIWKESGFYMIFFLAALQGIPRDLKEAAYIEGANNWQIFRRITLPLITPTILFISVIATINAFIRIEHLFSMTQGGPNYNSALLLYYLYENAFVFWDTAYAIAQSVFLIVLLSIIGIGQIFLMDRRVHYQ